MIRLHKAREPYWLDLPHGVRVHVHPMSTAISMAARAELQAVPGDPNALGGLHGNRQALLLKVLGRLAIFEWEGVGNVEGDETAPVTPEFVDALLDLPVIANAFEAKYLVPALLLELEKNVSATSLPGTSAAGSITAEAAAAAAPSALIN